MSAAYATNADLLALAPAMTASSGTMDAYRALAENWIGVSAWGDKASHAHALLTLHLMAAMGVAGGPGGGAQIASKTIGRLSVSYAGNAPPSDAELGTTSWGTLYISLRNTVAMVGEVGRSEGPLLLGMVVGPRLR